VSELVVDHESMNEDHEIPQSAKILLTAAIAALRFFW